MEHHAWCLQSFLTENLWRASESAGLTVDYANKKVSSAPLGVSLQRATFSAAAM